MLEVEPLPYTNAGSRLGENITQRCTGMRLDITAKNAALAVHQRPLRSVVRKHHPRLERELHAPIDRPVQIRRDVVKKLLRVLAERGRTRDAKRHTCLVEMAGGKNTRRLLYVQPPGVGPRTGNVRRVAGHELAGVHVLAE